MIGGLFHAQAADLRHPTYKAPASLRSLAVFVVPGGFKALKIMQLVTAGVIPLAVVFGIPSPEKVTAVLGLVILIVEGLQQLNQYQANWIGYRQTCEALRHEKYLFLALAGPYAKSEQPLALLADRIEGLISQENAKWISTQEQAGKSGEKSKP